MNIRNAPPFEGDEPTLKITLLDTRTGKTVVTEGPRAWEWTDNNWSCDCNRAALFGEPAPEDCEGGTRFVVTAVEPMLYGLSVVDFNPGYPEAVRAGRMPASGTRANPGRFR